MLGETQANRGAKRPARPRLSKYPVAVAVRFETATAEAVDELVRREGKTRSWVISDLVAASLQRLGMLAEPSDRAA